MSSTSSFAKRARTSAELGKASSHAPIGALPIKGIQLPALPRRVLIMPSLVVAAPPTDPEAASSLKPSQTYLKFPDPPAWVSLSVGYPTMVATRSDYKVLAKWRIASRFASSQNIQTSIRLELAE
jgi:hypothetical protein